MIQPSTKDESEDQPQQQSLMRLNLSPSKYQSNKATVPSKLRQHSHALVLGLIILTVILINVMQSTNILHSLNTQLHKSFHRLFSNQDKYVAGIFPKILWIQTRKDILGTLLTNHFQHVFSQSGYQVRFIDGLKSYNWLSQKMISNIKYTKHRSYFENRIEELLRVALLIEHGGIYIQLKDTIFIQDANWIQQYILRQIQQKEQHKNTDQPPFQVFMFNNIIDDNIKYSDNLMFAAPNSKLLNKVMLIMSKMLTLENVENTTYILQKKTNIDTHSQSYEDFVQNVINLQKKMMEYQPISFEKKYSIMNVNKDQPQFILNINAQNLMKILIKDKVQLFSSYGEKKMIFSPALNIVADYAVNMINNIMAFVPHQNSVLKTNIIDVPGNKEIFAPPGPMRDVNFCIISLTPLSEKNFENQINRNFKKLSQQTYKKWKIAYFLQNLQKKQMDFETSSGRYVKILNSSHMEGLNLQRALTQFCHQKDIAIILDHDEELGMATDLERIRHKIQPKNVYGVFVGILQKSSGKLYRKQMKKGDEILRKSQANNVQLYAQILNHFRIFSVQSYLFLPHFELHDINGNYYKRQIPLISINQVFQNYGNCDKNVYRYLLFKIDKVIDTPWYRESANDINFVTNSFKYPRCDGFQYNQRYRKFNLCEGVQYLWMGKRLPFQDYISLNDGQQFQGITSRVKRAQQIIPKITHQVWFGGQIPQFKKTLIKRLREYHPNYNHMLWTKQNITLQNFPFTYHLIQGLLQFNTKSPYNKLSLISDLIRFEAVYSYGGFYVDTNYMLLKQNGLDDFLSYKFVVSPYYTPTHMGVVQGGFYGAIKHYNPILNVLRHQSLSTRNIFSKEAHYQLGPHYFSWMLKKQDANDQDVLMLPMQYIYPYFPFFQGRKNLCFADLSTKPQNILLTHTFSYVKNCNQKYPYAYGIDLYDEGASWMRRAS